MRRVVVPAWLALVVLGAAASQAGSQQSEPRRSGSADMSLSLQAMQADRATNPAMLWVQQGYELWQAPPEGVTPAKPSCAQCHGDVRVSMRGVAAAYPGWDAAAQKPLNLAQRINQCRVRHQLAAPWKPESGPLLALESVVAYQSLNLPITPPATPQLKPFVLRGAERFRERMGQLNLSCAHCHEERAGQRLGGNLIPQAHPTAYPLYRLEWQGLGSLQRRLRNCMNGVRAQAYPFGADALLELELYLAERAAGMALETPGVRP